MDDQNDVVVRIEVRAPTGVGRRPMIYVYGQEHMRALNISLPQPGGIANVQAPLGATSGVICARGNGAIKNGVLAQFVYAQVYPGNLAHVPFNPPPMTPFTIPSGSDGQWSFALLSGAACNAGGTAANTLVTWTDFGGPGYDVQPISFSGKCSNCTDCTISGSGSGSGSGSSSSSGSIHARLAAEETAPRQWEAPAIGFTGPLKFFNRFWTLTASGAEGGPTVWDNGQDGETEARVELRQDRAAGLWLLTFRRQKQTVRYEKSAAEWQRLNANVLAIAKPSKNSPELVTVVPK